MAMPVSWSEMFSICSPIPTSIHLLYSHGSIGPRTVNEGFGRSLVDTGSMKIMKNGRNMTHMALLGLKLCQNECQRTAEFNGQPPDPHPHTHIEKHKEFKMADFGPAGER